MLDQRAGDRHFGAHFPAHHGREPRARGLCEAGREDGVLQQFCVDCYVVYLPPHLGGVDGFDIAAVVRNLLFNQFERALDQWPRVPVLRPERHVILCDVAQVGPLVCNTVHEEEAVFPKCIWQC